jgi:ATP phosphoribosyltransferase
LQTLQNGIPEENLVLAVPKKGPLAERSLKLLAGSGIKFDRPSRQDVAVCSGLPVTVVFLPDSDIASYIADGNVDLAITHSHNVIETGATVNQVCSIVQSAVLPS